MVLRALAHYGPLSLASYPFLLHPKFWHQCTEKLSFWDHFPFFWAYTRSKIAESCGNYMFNFYKYLQTVFHSCYIPLYIPTNSAQCFNFPTSSPHLFSGLFDSRHLTDVSRTVTLCPSRHKALLLRPLFKKGLLT